MDFFGILFDIKNGSKMPYNKNYFDTLFAAKLGNSDVKTLTGTLPLTFRTSETALRAWTIYGNNTQHNYSAEGTLPLTFTTHTAGAASDWVIYGNDDNGTENLFDPTATDTSKGYVNNSVIYMYDNIAGSTSLWCVSEYLDINDCTKLLLRMTSDQTGTAVDPAIVFYDSSKARISGVKYNTRQVNNIIIEFNVPEGANFVRFSAFKGDNTTVELLKNITQQTAPDHYIPYQQGVGEQRVDGYYVPIIVSQQGQTDKTIDIYIGDSPLTEGQQVSKTSTGVDIELFEGENTVSTTLYNKPETSITYTDYLGVGEYVNGQWQIPLTVSDGTNTTTVNIPIDAPLTEGQSVSDTVEITTYEGTNTLDTTLDNKPTMTITYK